MKRTIATLSVTLLFGCAATPKTPVPTGGSKTDGMVELSYTVTPIEKPEVQWEQALLAAKQKCLGWGYSDAEKFGGQSSACEELYPDNSCYLRRYTVAYQCLE